MGLAARGRSAERQRLMRPGKEAETAWGLGRRREFQEEGQSVASKGPCKVSQGAKECALGRQQGGLGGEEKELGGGAEGKQG